MPAALADTVERALTAVARARGTPAYAYDLARLRGRVDELRRTVPEAVEVYYSLKANPAPALCRSIAEHGLGAEVVSVGELEVALAAGFPHDRILVGGPYKPPELLDRLRHLERALISVDSSDELGRLSRQLLRSRFLLRLRPGFEGGAAMPTDRRSRFGIPASDLERCREVIEREKPSIAGFHVYCGSQVLDGARLVRQLHESVELCLRAAQELDVEPKVLDLGGGFGVPYGPDDAALDLGSVAAELARLAARAAPARLVLELGRYVVADSGWYLTSVVGFQVRDGRQVVVVDGGIHQRSDLCGLDLQRHASAPAVLGSARGALRATDVVGCLCLPGDVLAEGCSLPALSRGDVLAFANAGAYGLTAAPVLFLGHAPPAEAFFDGEEIQTVDAPEGSEDRVGRRFVEGRVAVAGGGFNLSWREGGS